MRHFHILIVGIFCLITIGAKAQGITISNCAEFPVCMPFNSCTAATASVWLDATTTCFNPNVNFSYKVEVLRCRTWAILLPKVFLLG
jgi:hypothetical protein